MFTWNCFSFYLLPSGCLRTFWCCSGTKKLAFWDSLLNKQCNLREIRNRRSAFQVVITVKPISWRYHNDSSYGVFTQKCVVTKFLISDFLQVRIDEGVLLEQQRKESLNKIRACAGFRPLLTSLTSVSEKLKWERVVALYNIVRVFSWYKRFEILFYG